MFGHEFGQKRGNLLNWKYGRASQIQKGGFMNKFIHIFQYVQYLFDDREVARKASRIVEGILKGRSPRLSDIAREMDGNEAANYKQIQRFIQQVDPREALLRLFQSEAPFLIGDPTEMPRPQAKKTEYVGTISDGETSGYWLLFLATPFRGRAIPCHFVSYSSKTINQEATSRNQHHFEAIAKTKELLGGKPLVLDREFSYLELMENMAQEGVNFVIRLKESAHFYDDTGKRVPLSITQGETRLLNKVFYMGKVFVNVIGIWQKGFAKPMWIMTNLNAQDGLELYQQRMKIEECFRDMKNLLGLEKLMNKSRKHMEKMVALLMIAYVIGLWLGETLREKLFPANTPKHKLYSGLFILLKLKPNISSHNFTQLSLQALASFSQLILIVRTHV